MCVHSPHFIFSLIFFLLLSFFIWCAYPFPAIYHDQDQIKLLRRYCSMVKGVRKTKSCWTIAQHTCIVVHSCRSVISRNNTINALLADKYTYQEIIEHFVLLISHSTSNKTKFLSLILLHCYLLFFFFHIFFFFNMKF